VRCWSLFGLVYITFIFYQCVETQDFCIFAKKNNVSLKLCDETLWDSMESSNATSYVPNSCSTTQCVAARCHLYNWIFLKWTKNGLSSYLFEQIFLAVSDNNIRQAHTVVRCSYAPSLLAYTWRFWSNQIKIMMRLVSFKAHGHIYNMYKYVIHSYIMQ
jgi:hypothetical protein